MGNELWLGSKFAIAKGGVNRPIIANGTTLVTYNASKLIAAIADWNQALTVSDIQVLVVFSHPQQANVTIIVSHDTAVSTLRAMKKGGGTSNVTYFDAATATAKTSKPLTPLSGFDGLTPDGLWTLEIDNAATVKGTIMDVNFILPLDCSPRTARKVDFLPTLGKKSDNKAADSEAKATKKDKKQRSSVTSSTPLRGAQRH
jgi:hypothetical protein